jgi:hypothetical protein
MAKCIPNGSTIHIPKGLKIYQQFPFQGPPKTIQIGIFGFKIFIPSGNPAQSLSTKNRGRQLQRLISRNDVNFFLLV